MKLNLFFFCDLCFSVVLLQANLASIYCQTFLLQVKYVQNYVIFEEQDLDVRENVTIDYIKYSVMALSHVIHRVIFDSKVLIHLFRFNEIQFLLRQ